MTTYSQSIDHILDSYLGYSAIMRKNIMQKNFDVIDVKDIIVLISKISVVEGELSEASSNPGPIYSHTIKFKQELLAYALDAITTLKHENTYAEENRNAVQIAKTFIAWLTDTYNQHDVQVQLRSFTLEWSSQIGIFDVYKKEAQDVLFCYDAFHDRLDSVCNNAPLAQELEILQDDITSFINMPNSEKENLVTFNDLQESYTYART